jgi:hypothetical protein
MSGSMSFNNLSSFNNMKTSESFSDLNAEMNNMNENQTNPSETSSTANTQGPSNFSPSDPATRSIRSTLGGLGNMNNRCEDGLNNKPFGLGKTV